MNRFISAIFLITLFSMQMSPVHALDVREIDSVLVTWPGAATPSTNIAEIQRNVENDVSRNWMRFTSSIGAMKDLSIKFEFGKSVESISISGPMPCEGAKSAEFMNQIRAETYRRLGLEDWTKRYLVILVPNAGCIWQGKALLGNPQSSGGVLTLHDTSSAFVITHELGHTLGLGHTNFLRCISGVKDGPWGSDCKAVEYGGTIDVMGNVSTNSPLSTYHQWRLGLIQGDQVMQSWTTEKIELSSSDSDGRTRAIFLRDGDSTYWIEYRGGNSALYGYQPGLVIFRTDPPPLTALISPNPEDSQGNGFGSGIGTDLWMLNLDSYRYTNGRASGSMTLPSFATATLHSGNISISATSNKDENSAIVSIVRAKDTASPPTPRLIPSSAWRSSESEIIFPGFEDKETSVAAFEIRTNGVVTTLFGSDSPNWAPTYIAPLKAPKTILVRDLPEGSYSLSIRSVDYAGNKSEWSTPEEVFIDRGFPIVKNEFNPISASRDKVVLQWSGATDNGTGLCETSFSNSYGFVFYQDNSRQRPEFAIKVKESFSGTANVIDCSGNAISTSINLQADYRPAEESKRTGLWREVQVAGASALHCQSRCSASFSAVGNISVLAGRGRGEIYVSNKKVGRFESTTEGASRTIYSNNFGKSRKVLRITGTDITLIGIVNYEVTLGPLIRKQFPTRIKDSSLEDINQSRLSQFGFSSLDFAPGWTILPMARGTTLQDPTLDLCEFAYSSESSRKFRRQVVATSPNSQYEFLSTEVVDYGTPTSSKLALSELKTNFSKCVEEKGGTGRNGLKVEYKFYEMPIKNLTLMPESQRVLVRATIGTGSLTRQLLGFYQFSGPYFSGLYIVKQGPSPFSDSESYEWAKVASVLAFRLST